MADIFAVPQRGTKEYDKWVNDQKLQLAKSTAAFAKANPTASAGVALAAGKAGVAGYGNLASSMTTLDLQSSQDKQRNAALAASAKYKDSNNSGNGSPVDFLAPLTRTAFMALTTPYELLEASVRNIAGGKNPFDNLLGQTETGQAMMQLLKTGKVDVGTGFLNVDPNSAVGKALLKAQLKAGPKMAGGQPWTYQSGLTQALFDNPETKAAKTFQAVSGFVLNLALDPLTYVPGLGLLKISKEGVALRTGKAAVAGKSAKVIRDEKTVENAAGARRIISAAELEDSELAGRIAQLQKDYDEALPEAQRLYELTHKAKNASDIADAKYGATYRAAEEARAAHTAATAELDTINARRQALQEMPLNQGGLSAAGRTSDVIEILDKTPDAQVLRNVKQLERDSRVAKGLVYTAEEVPLVKGGRAVSHGFANDAEQIVELAGKKKPNLVAFNAPVDDAGTLFDAVAALGDRGAVVAETIARDGATNADIIKAAKTAGVEQELYAAYAAAGIDGFTGIGKSVAYVPSAVKTFQHDVSWWARHAETPTLAPEAAAGVVEQGAALTAANTKVAREQLRSEQATVRAAKREEMLAASGTRSAYRTLTDAEKALTKAEANANATKRTLSEADARYAAAVRSAKDAASARNAAKLHREEIYGIHSEAIDYLAGITHIDDAKILDYQQFSDFMFGKLGRGVAAMIARDFKPTDSYKLWQALGAGNISIDTAKALAAAETEKEVLAIFAANAGIDLSGATKASLAARAIQFKPQSQLLEASKMRYTLMQDFFGKSRILEAGQAVAGTKAGQAVGNAMRLVPTRAAMNLNDGDLLAREMYNAIPYMKGSVELRDRMVALMMEQTTTSGRFNVFMDAISGVVAENVGKMNPEQAKLFEEAARVFKQENEIQRNFLAQVAAEGGNVKKVLSNGKALTVGEHDPFLTSQLSDIVRWPDIEEMRQLSGAMRELFSKGTMGHELRNAALDIFDRRFKQLVLVGRVSYITRNLMDMQVRMYLGGSATVFSHPFQYLSMMLGNPEGSAFARQLAKYSRFDRDAMGREFSKIATSEENAKFGNTVRNEVNKYSNTMSQANGFGIGATTLSGKLPTGMRFITPAERGFNKAWATAILQYRADDAARLVAGGLLDGFKEGDKFVYKFPEAEAFIKMKEAQGFDRSKDYVQLITDYMFETGHGKKLRETIANVDLDARGVMLDDDINVAKEATQAYFEIIAQGVDNLAGGNRAIRDFIAGRRMKDAKNIEHVFDSTKNQPQDQWLAKLLQTHRGATDIENAIGQLKLPGEWSARKGGLIARFDEASAKFFHVSAGLEKRTSLGPEYRQQYWNGIAKNIHFATKSDAEKMLAIAERELRSSSIAGVKVGATNPALVKIRAAIKDLDEAGIGVADMDAIAQGHASRQLNKLFYNATQQRQYAAAARIAMPFVQAWANTLDVWGKLITKDITNTFRLQGQARAYKAANAFDFLTHPETGALYEWLGDNWYDPSQGFIFNDPTYGDKRVVIPFAGDLLGAMMSMTSGQEVPGMPTSLSVPSLNMAFSNELLPGVGPALQMSVGKLIDGQNGWIADQVRNIIYPYGQPSSGAQGVVESFTPAWAQRLLYGLHFDSYEQKNMSTLKPIMAYLATTGKYGDMPITAEQQQKLLDDSMRVNRTLALWRGIIANVSPGSISPMILAKDKTGDLHVQALMVNDFAQIRANNPDNYAAAIAKWADKYGDNALFSLVSGSRGGVTPTSKAWDFYTNNREDASKYPNAFMLFFPGGEYSSEFAKWQEQVGQRFKLTPAEMQMEAARYVYSARKAKLQQDEATAVAQGADPKDAHQVYLSRKAAMDNEFGGQPDYKSAGVPQETLVKELSSAVQDRKFAATDAGKGLVEFLEYRQAALDSVAAAGLKTLTGSKVENVAQWLDENAYRIIKEHPEFSVMYWRVFASETGNN